ncbi:MULTISPECIES: UDP-N-acetylmuramoyl-tripeptide--D-alanyl-D-alanine ligase [unclassified Halanaerobium]|uniref:UDP-N-acetylmuramoyl-tripeptide--D-alanyl-D- alanine ligase n=1 Tax=unclassified Halanaerobium TaxID=2641197 RepID=UPI000DF396A6|nr:MULTISPECIES: UDP-N-acetylmuramoyl-tripeptide--D-alanyl-D-alanine ligase [unclassified Halanaerobium]RCW51378.1 UDP-N-acetylmuramoyl-tripeptide--D-alanyl-D-alanine ligase [Halanaerobium sp. MA284_MarDTE_T2]RCW81423.1 UDP-N-acetylmuramoyl-tripeptide--D-alanyl-D-alanine ligase [Halanaerobium sp. DL-01]
MQELNIRQIKEAVNGKIIQGNPKSLITDISIDSREVMPGDLFIPIIGKNNDGHNFIEEAVDNGAEAVIVDRAVKSYPHLAIILVKDTTCALQDLAHYYRMRFFDLEVIGVTGSAGKTTSKDMIAAVISEKYDVLKTGGNYNNHIGLPLTLFKLSGKEDFAVLEMGMSGLGEIKLLSSIAFPKYGVVTNVGPAHLKQLGSVTKIAEAKSELIESLPKDGIAFLNYDDNNTRKMAANFSGRTVFFGCQAGADYQVIKSEYIIKESRHYFTVLNSNKKYIFYLRKPGQHNIYNALPAVAIGFELGLSKKEIQNGLNRVKYSPLRMDIFELKNKSIIINDTYNANPLSMRAALDVLSDLKGKRKIAVLGGMLELGERTRSAHLRIGDYLYQQNYDILLTVGHPADIIAEGALEAGMYEDNVILCSGNRETAEHLLHIISADDLILIKGSRANKMEEIVDILREQEEQN